MVSRARADVPKHSLQMLNQDPREASRTPNSCQKGPWGHRSGGGVGGGGGEVWWKFGRWDRRGEEGKERQLSKPAVSE